MRILILVSALLTTAVLAQQGQPGAVRPTLRPDITGTALVVGQVVDADTARPVPSAVVTISGTGISAPRRVMTDPQGRFVFRALARGAFSITATKPGWSDGAHGRRRPNGSTQPLELADGERATNVRIPLWRFGAISGTVTDDRGDPVIAVEVRALRRTFIGGHRRLVGEATAQTDDRGMFRLGSLMPGKYIVVLPPGQPASATPSLVPLASANRSWMYQIAFYPSASIAADASVIALHSSEERSNIDLQLRLVPAVSVSGRLVSPSGPVGGNSVPRLMTADDVASDLALGSTTYRPDGTFTFFGVAAGRYVIQAQQPGRPGPVVLPSTLERLPAAFAAGSTLAGSLPVDVGESDVTDLEVVLREGVRVTGRLEFDGAAVVPAPERLGQIPVVIESVISQYEAGAPPSGRVISDRQFLAAGVRPGKYFVRISQSPASWTFKSATLGGRDVSDLPLEIETDDVSNILIRFTDRISEITGTVLGAAGADAGATVLLFPVDTAYWQDFGLNPRRMKSNRADVHGRYHFSGVPEGRYFLVAIPEEDCGDWPNPEFLSVLSRTATQVEISDGDKRTLDVRVSVVPR